MNIPSAQIIAEYYPGVPAADDLGEYEALFGNRKIRSVLGFRQEHSWRKYVSSEV